jgi:hypothetical protein
MTIKPKDFVQARKTVYGWKLRLYPLFWDLNESEKSSPFPSTGEKWWFFAKK